MVKNRLGSTVRSWSVQSGAVRINMAADYDAWGRQMHLKEDANREELAQRFTGKETDKVSGLDYFPARYRDPDLGGMWISPDNARQFPNLYSYGTNPLNSVDPDGNQQELSSLFNWSLFGSGWDQNSLRNSATNINLQPPNDFLKPAADLTKDAGLIGLGAATLSGEVGLVLMNPALLTGGIVLGGISSVSLGISTGLSLLNTTFNYLGGSVGNYEATLSMGADLYGGKTLENLGLPKIGAELTMKYIVDPNISPRGKALDKEFCGVCESGKR